MGPDAGEALWFNGGLGLIKAAAETTDGRFFAMEIRAPKGFAAPLHVHRDADEFFIVVTGDVRIQHGEDIFEAEPGSLCTDRAKSPTRSTWTPRMRSSC